MYAVIETGGKQYRVQKGDVISVEKLQAAVGDTVAFDKVMVLGEGADVQVGTPYLDAVVRGTVVEVGKSAKVVVFKYKAKKDYRKKQGHRQPYTTVRIESLGAEGEDAADAADAKAEAADAADVKAEADAADEADVKAETAAAPAPEKADESVDE